MPIFDAYGYIATKYSRFSIASDKDIDTFYATLPSTFTSEQIETILHDLTHELYTHEHSNTTLHTERPLAFMIRVFDPDDDTLALHDTAFLHTIWETIGPINTSIGYGR